MYAEIMNIYTYETKHNVGGELVLSNSISSYVDDKKKESYQQLVKSYSEKKCLQDILDEAITGELIVVDRLKEAMNEWDEAASYTKILMDALELQKANEVVSNAKHDEDMVCNVWMADNESLYNIHEISNQTYKMGIHIYERTKYNRQKEKSETVAYEVSYYLSTNSPLCKNYSYSRHNSTIQSIDRKVIKDKDRMLKYVDGRKRAFAYYFKEDRPPILSEHKEVFMLKGILLDGYEVVDEIKK